MTSIKVEYLSGELENDIPPSGSAAYHEPDKCGEVFVTRRGIFSCFCIVCKQNFEEIHQFTEHILTFHLKHDFTSSENNLLDFKKDINGNKKYNINKPPITDNLLSKTNQPEKINIACLKSSLETNVEIKHSNQLIFDPLECDYEGKIATEKIKTSTGDILWELEVCVGKEMDEISNYSDDDEETSDFNEAEMDEKLPFKCDICNRSYKLKNAFIAHKKRHDNVMPSCKHCGKNFVDKQSFKRHNQILCAQRKELGVKNTSKNLPDIKCKYCPKIFKRYSSLQSHEDRHLNSPFKCEHCPRTYMMKHLLDDHLRTHTGERPYKCEYCAAAFTHITNLSRHNLIHVGKKTVICTFGCGKAFYKERERIGHERTHTGEKPFVCELCGRYFAYQCKLSLHKKRFHMDKKNWPHKCDQCGKAFIAPKQLREHAVVHTGEKPFACDQCPGRFSKGTGLREHKKLHTGVKKHVCTICNKAFAQTAGLYGHMKSHGIIKENAEIS